VIETSLCIIIAKTIHINRLVAEKAVEIIDFFGYNLAMPRPRKDKSERKDHDLRIPLTADQKVLILEMARLEGVDMATWARPILLEAARRGVEARRERAN
jgi:hypothetical protein